MAVAVAKAVAEAVVDVICPSSIRLFRRQILSHRKEFEVVLKVALLGGGAGSSVFLSRLLVVAEAVVAVLVGVDIFLIGVRIIVILSIFIGLNRIGPMALWVDSLGYFRKEGGNTEFAFDLEIYLVTILSAIPCFPVVTKLLDAQIEVVVHKSVCCIKIQRALLFQEAGLLLVVASLGLIVLGFLV